MLQYIVILFMWSVSSLLFPTYCLNILDLNFCVYIGVMLLDSTSHTQKAYKTLRAEYSIIAGTNSKDIFLYIWSTIHCLKALCLWLALGLFVDVSPISCVRGHIPACIMLLYALFVKEYSNGIRKWWISRYYETVVTIPENAI